MATQFCICSTAAFSIEDVFKIIPMIDELSEPNWITAGDGRRQISVNRRDNNASLIIDSVDPMGETFNHEMTDRDIVKTILCIRVVGLERRSIYSELLLFFSIIADRYPDSVLI